MWETKIKGATGKLSTNRILRDLGSLNLQTLVISSKTYYPKDKLNGD